MTPRQLRKLCQLKPEAMSILKAAMEELGLSARAHDKILGILGPSTFPGSRKWVALPVLGTTTEPVTLKAATTPEYNQ